MTIRTKGATKKLVHGNKKLAGWSQPLRAFYQGYVTGAFARGVLFLLEPDEFKALTKENCVYCGKAPELRSVGWKAYTEAFQGIDRINPDKPYMPGNVAPACKRCNHMKQSSTTARFLARLEQIAALETPYANHKQHHIDHARAVLKHQAILRTAST